MRVLVNALSVNNASGRHVLLGHLSCLARWTVGTHDFVILHHAANRDLVRDLGPNVAWRECPPGTMGWQVRSWWEWRILPEVVREVGAQALFTPAGISYPGVTVPQVVFAQNPWCLVPRAHRGFGNALKAALQRRAYRRAMREAEVMVFNSEFMRSAYRINAGCEARSSHVVYQGIDDETFVAAVEMSGKVSRQPLKIVSVSAMAPHKGVETLVEALHLVCREHAIPATLELVGAWPDAGYERSIRQRVETAGLARAVTFRGHVSRDDLHRAYAEAKVYALMSWCESFGIPAVEAQAFGTPVVTANCCAMPEIDGEGGLYPRPGDATGTAAALAQLLTDETSWADLSVKALANARRFSWSSCSRPLVEVFGQMTEDG